MSEPVKVYSWSMGYCDAETHFGIEHPLYTSSDGGCKNFVTSERLLEIKQLFDAANKIEELEAEIGDFYKFEILTLKVEKIDFDGWISEENYDAYEEKEWYSIKDENITLPKFFHIVKYRSWYRLTKVVQLGPLFSSLEEAQKFAEEENNG